MSRGLGDTQRAALTVLADADAEGCGVWMHALADTLGLEPRRCRALVASLVSHDQAHTVLRGWREADAMPRRATLVCLGEYVKPAWMRDAHAVRDAG